MAAPHPPLWIRELRAPAALGEHELLRVLGSGRLGLGGIVKQKFKRWVAVLVVVVVTGGIALNILAYRHAYAMTHFTAGNPRTLEPEKLTTGQKFKVLLREVNIQIGRAHV